MSNGIGIAGHRRTESKLVVFVDEKSAASIVHLMSNIDNIDNLFSLDCLGNKDLEICLVGVSSS